MKRIAAFVARNASALAQSLVVVWLGASFGKAIVPFVVETIGAGGYSAALVAGLVTSGFTFVATLLLRMAVNRVQHLLLPGSLQP